MLAWDTISGSLGHHNNIESKAACLRETRQAQAHQQSGYLKGLWATCQAASKKTSLSCIGASSKVHHFLHKVCIFRKCGTEIQPVIHILQNSKHGVNLSGKWNKTLKHTLIKVWSYSAKDFLAFGHISKWQWFLKPVLNKWLRATFGPNTQIRTNLDSQKCLGALIHILKVPARVYLHFRNLNNFTNPVQRV